ncbi:9877_t:CDS:2 [Diversispora eburnea]|uniref:tRNA(Ile)-lysidine synthetase n=1 Tax=Diversispora eburnea TaxID=1213867 RepID=A0A9N9G9T8_9GLOM|nr:9877_t:CDS:2 [Diversispora eburnea]
MQIQWNTKIESKFSPSHIHNYPRTSQLELFARNERYKLLATGCHEKNISLLFLGHHLNDQLETLVMRLARGSGIVGLASMETNNKFPVQRNIEALNINVVRPMLRERMIETCKAANIQWFEDPTNESDQHKRNVVRMVLNTINQRYLDGHKEYEPISTQGLLRFMDHMEYHKKFVNLQVNEILSECVKFNYQIGFCKLWLPKKLSKNHWFRQKHLGIRIISTLIRWVTCSEAAPLLEGCIRFYNHLTLSYEQSVNENFSAQGVLLCTGKEQDYKNSNMNSWVFYRQPMNKAEEKLTINIIKDKEIILWDKRRFKKDDFPIVSRQLLKIKAKSNKWKIFQDYRSNVHVVARHDIPVLIRRDKNAEPPLQDKLIAMPSLNISFSPEYADCWAEFRGQIY